MEEKCPYYQGVCGIDEQYVCYSMSNTNCPLRIEYEKKLKDGGEFADMPTLQSAT